MCIKTHWGIVVMVNFLLFFCAFIHCSGNLLESPPVEHFGSILHFVFLFHRSRSISNHLITNHKLCTCNICINFFDEKNV